MPQPHSTLHLSVGPIDLREDRLIPQRAGDDGPPLRRTGTFEHASVGVEERRVRVVSRLGDRRSGRCDSVRVGELHAGELRSDFGCHQCTVTGIDIGTQRTGQKRTTSAGDHYRACRDAVVLVFVTLVSGDSANSAGTVHQQLECRRMVEDPHSGSTNPGAHPSHVFRPLQAGADLLARAGVDGERISALHREEIHVGVGLLEDAVHPMVVGKISAERLTTGLCPLTGSRIRFDVPNTRSGGGRCAARSAVALVDQDDVCTGLGRAQRCPCAGGATTDHQYIGGEFEDVRHWPAPVRGLRNTSVAAIFLERTTQRHSQNHCELNQSLPHRQSATTLPAPRRCTTRSTWRRLPARSAICVARRCRGAFPVRHIDAHARSQLHV